MPRVSIQQPVFILSSPRAGSTLVFETLAGSASLFTIGGESHQIIEGLASLAVGPWGVSSNRLDTSHATPRIATAIRTRFAENLKDRDGRPANGPVRMLEKTPKNALRVPFINTIFPDALFIYLYRDPRENLGSMMEAWRSGGWVTYDSLPDWTGPWSMLLPPGYAAMQGRSLAEIVAFQWISANGFILDDLSVLPRQRWVAISYQSFIQRPSEIVRQLCDFIGIEPDPGLLVTVEQGNLPLSSRTLTPPMSGKWHRDAGLIRGVLPEISLMYRRILESVLPQQQAEAAMFAYTQDNEVIFSAAQDQSK